MTVGDEDQEKKHALTDIAMHLCRNSCDPALETTCLIKLNRLDYLWILQLDTFKFTRG